jgi:hypothetical protein
MSQEGPLVVSDELRKKEGTMLIRTWRFMTIILTALTMGMAFCHLLQMPPRMRLDGALWLASNALYQLFGTVGAVIDIGAWILAVVLTILVRQRRPAFQWTLFGTVCLIVAHVAWWGFIAPVNAELAIWTPESIPADWTRLRAQWEYTHAARAVLQILGLSAFVLSVLAETPTDHADAFITTAGRRTGDRSTV